VLTWLSLTTGAGYASGKVIGTAAFLAPFSKVA